MLVLANPGHGLENMKASPAMYLGLQLLLPGEYMEASYHINGTRQQVKQGSGDRAWTRAGLAPTAVFTHSDQRYPMLRYPWVDARAALVNIAANAPQLDCVQVTYVNPETGGDAQNILGFDARMQLWRMKPKRWTRWPKAMWKALSPNCSTRCRPTLKITTRALTWSSCCAISTAASRSPSCCWRTASSCPPWTSCWRS